MSKFCIDAGHNHSGVDTGARGSRYNEQDLSFLIANELRKIIENAGHSVKMTRNTITSNVSGVTVSESLSSRAKISNDYGADYFISIHLNSGGGVGTETYVLQKGGQAERFANEIQKNLINLGRTNRCVKTGNFAVLRLTNCPAVLVEVGFIDNAAEEKWISENVNSIARAIADAYGVTEIAEPMSATEAIAYLTQSGIITEPDKWYQGTWDDDDFKWLIRKCAQYIKDNIK